MARTDQHRPSAINPIDYEYVTFLYHGSDLFLLAESRDNREELRQAMKATGGKFSQHDHKGDCHICGAYLTYEVIYYHEKSNTYIKCGVDCAGKLRMGDSVLFRSAKEKLLKGAEVRAGKHKAQTTLNDKGLGLAWQIFNGDAIEGPASAKDTILDIVRKLVTYGELSEKQYNFLTSLVDRVKNYKSIIAEREAEKAKAQDCPTGRTSVKGEIVKIEPLENEYGTRLVMTVKAQEGFLIWGTVPKAFWDAQRGDRVEFTATITPSEKDTKFGFFKRPTKAKNYQGSNQ